MFSGVWTALITPLKKDKVDYEALAKLIDYQYKSGIDGIVPCGSTGESSTLSHEEHKAVIEFCVKEAKGKMRVLAGSGSNSTKEAIYLTEFAKNVGCDGALLISPYYNKPTQEGLYLHFKEIADKVNIPIVLYNIAGRTSINIEPETIARLIKDCPNIIGVKEASGSLDQMSRIKSLAPRIELISGDDALTLPLMAIGGVGIISVLSNIIPAEIVSLVKAFNSGDIKEAIRIHYKTLPLVKAMFLETNPIPVKTAASMMGLCALEFRLPMCPLSAQNKNKVEIALKDFGLLK
ncbi:MAG: 4-hydroxy-tetrahydrodipicolinate synthase [Elusimicrobiota bacterium]|jgi:4-hydroxy-tetrahydrodipicolinate synthase|nr:4-hydroxy-tetrahydrodipicolinate synthase [Elusimicrobiota bacterium]